MPLNEMQSNIVKVLNEGNQPLPTTINKNPDLKQPSTITGDTIKNTSSGIHKAGQGFITKFVSWLYHSVVHLAESFKNDVVDFIHTHIFSDIEKYGMDALNIASNLFMSGMTFSGPTSTEGAEKNRLLGWAKNAGVGILSNVGNLAGEIPSLGQVNGAGQSLMNIAGNVGMNLQMNQMNEPTVEEHVEKPLKSAAVEEAQASTLSVDDVKAAYARGELSDTEMSAQLHDLGYSEDMHPVIMNDSLNQLSADQIQGMVRSQQISSNEAAGLLRQNGYSAENSVKLVQSANNDQMTQINNNIQQTLMEMKNQNQISDTDFQDMLRSMGVEETNIENLIKSVNSKSIVDEIQKEITNILRLYQTGKSSEEDTVAALKTIEVDDGQIAKLLEDIQKEANRNNSSDVLVSIQRSFHAGLLDEQTFVSELKKMGTSEDKIAELLSAAQKKAATNGGTAKQMDLVNQNMLNVAYAEGHISKEDFVSMSHYIGTAPDIVDILSGELNVGGVLSGQIIPIDNLEEAVVFASMSDSEATTYLRDGGYSPTQISILLDTWHKKGTVLGYNGVKSTNSAAPDTGLTSGTNYSSISAENYDNILHALGMTPDQINSVLGMIYRSLIEAGFVTQTTAITFLTNGGIDSQTAREIIG